MLPTTEFGRTGHLSSRVIFGAAALSGCSQDKADRVLAQLLAAGVNHIDTAASYGDSELRVAPWMLEHRDDFFLATKTGEREGGAARAELELSLTRLGVDRVDLIQLHNLVEPDEWEQVHAAGGALEAMIAARDDGLVRFIGVTGHGTRIPRMHLRSLDAFAYDSVLFPYNVTMMADDTYRVAVEDLLARCAADNVAAQTIKSIARRRWNEADQPRFSWYEPLDDQDAIARSARYVLSNSLCFLNTSSDTRYLDAVLKAAQGDLSAPSADELEADVMTFGMKALFDGTELERI